MTSTGPHSGPNEPPTPQRWHVREPGVPTTCVLDGHGGHDLLGHFAGHRPENALTYNRMRSANHLLGDAGSGSGKDFRRRLDVESG